MSVYDEIQLERERQKYSEGFTVEKDDLYSPGTLSLAASCLAERAYRLILSPPERWPWDHSFWKMCPPRRALIKAAALIVAEIDRIDRAVGNREMKRDG